MPGRRGSAEERFWTKVVKTDDCWLWTAATTKGYGVMGAGGRGEGLILAHRFSWELVNGPVPDGLQLDHRRTCPKNCVRPDHLRPATDGQNKQNQAGAYRSSKSGVRGVSWHGRTQKWRAQAQRNGKNFYGGLFSTIEEAEEAAIALRRKLFTHSDMDVAERNTLPTKEGEK